MAQVFQQNLRAFVSVPSSRAGSNVIQSSSVLPRTQCFRRNPVHAFIAKPVGVSRPAPFRVACPTKAQAVVVTEAEKKANHERWKESGNSSGSADEWEWTLNWDNIVEGITVGSCPRSASDVDRIIDEGAVDAIVCLQCDDCLAALQVDMNDIRQRAVDRGVAHVQVAIRDFDRQDQARMLPEAAKMIGLLRRSGHRVYVHCTAGINRAPLAVVGYLTFVEGMPLYDAVKFVKSRRHRANPYVECLKDARTQLLVAETKQVLRIAEELYTARRNKNAPEDGFADWVAAENLALKMLFERQLAAHASLLTNIKCRQGAALDVTARDLDEKTDVISVLRKNLQAKQQQLDAALRDLEQAQHQLKSFQKRCGPNCGSLGFEQLGEKDNEIAALRNIVVKFNEASRAALSEC